MAGNVMPVTDQLSSLRWHYGPTEADPDPGGKWCYDCGSEVFFIEGRAGCSGCGREEPAEARITLPDCAQLSVDLQGDCPDCGHSVDEHWHRSGFWCADCIAAQIGKGSTS